MGSSTEDRRNAATEIHTCVGYSSRSRPRDEHARVHKGSAWECHLLRVLTPLGVIIGGQLLRFVMTTSRPHGLPPLPYRPLWIDSGEPQRTKPRSRARARPGSRAGIKSSSPTNAVMVRKAPTRLTDTRMARPDHAL
jgi:hypothetical protein